LFAEARAAFATCLAQASAADALLERELFPACRSGDEAVAAAIARLEELHP
jgi:invasion protein IalB